MISTVKCLGNTARQTEELEEIMTEFFEVCELHFPKSVFVRFGIVKGLQDVVVDLKRAIEITTGPGKGITEIELQSECRKLLDNDTLPRFCQLTIDGLVILFKDRPFLIPVTSLNLSVF